MKILITGALGFIGTNLSKRLLSDGYQVTGVDNIYSSTRSRIKELEKFDSFTFIEHDIIEKLILPEKDRPDFICNFACPASPVQYLKDPIYTIKTNCYGTHNMLDLATAYNIPILHASTSEVYGDPLEHPQKESYWGNVNPIGPRACYDEGKRLAESLCFDYKRKYNIKIKIIRIFNTYGPFMSSDDGRVVSNFITQALQNRPLTIYGDGTQTRSFCYIDDLVEGICKFMFLHDPENKITGPINLGCPQEITMHELITYLRAFFPAITTKHHPLPEDDPVQRKPDISRAKTHLQWTPTYSIERGLQLTIDWFHQISNTQTQR